MASRIPSLVVNSPFIPLFIGFTLIAAEDSLEASNGGAPKGRKLLETLMPLQFGPQKEP